MKLFLAFVFIVLLLPLNSIFGQVKYFENRLSNLFAANVNDDLACIIVETDSAFVVTGRYSTSNDYSTYTSYLSNIDINGNWSNIIHYESDSILGDFAVQSITKSPIGYKATGYISTNQYDEKYYTILAYIDSEGNIIDLKNITPTNNASLGYSITQNTEGDLFIGGYYTPLFISPNREKLYLTKLNANGDKLWEYTKWTFPYNCVFTAVLPTIDGGCYAAGYINAYLFNESGEFYLSKINANGGMAWEKIYDVGSTDACYGMAYTQTEDGLILCGESGFRKAHLLKANLLGDSLWSKKYFLNEYQSVFLKVASLMDNTYVTIGSIRTSPTSSADLLITKVDSLGNLLWHRRYGSPDVHDYGYDFTPTTEPKGGFVVVGRADTIAMVSGQNWSLGRGYIVKTNCMGLLTLPQAAYTVAQDPAFPGRFLFTNHSQYAYPDSIDGGYYVWQWGDGSPPYICGQGYAPCPPDAQPLAHTYQSTGIYPITLQAIVCNDTSTFTRAVCLGVEPNPQAQFTYNDFGGAIQFTNLSQNAYFAQGGYCVWDFGDGSPPVYDANPTHTYTDNGNYPVTLTVVVCQDTSVYMQFVQVQTVGIPQAPPFFEGGQGGEQVLVYPNPAQNTLHFSLTNSLTPLSEGWSVTLYAPAGQQVLHSSASLVGTQAMATHTVQVGHLPVGMYFYTVQSGGVVLARGKVAVVR